MSRTIDEILLPGGRPLGVKSTCGRHRARVREVPGGQAEAEAMFAELTEGGVEATPVGYPGQAFDLPDGRGWIGLRPVSGSGPPTIDVEAFDAAGQQIPVTKIKFVG